MKFKQESAETLALDAMGWLVANDEILSVFLDSSGTSAGDLAPWNGGPRVPRLGSRFRSDRRPVGGGIL